VKETTRIMKNPDLDGALKGAALIAAAQRAEHYEMAGYSTVAAWARTPA
jgi:ferritin-like metal-binding protein YciE